MTELLSYQVLISTEKEYDRLLQRIYDLNQLDGLSLDGLSEEENEEYSRLLDLLDDYEDNYMPEVKPHTSSFL